MYSIVLQALEAEMHGRWPRCEAICATGQDLVNGGHGARAEIGSKINNLMDKWKLLKELAALRRTKIEDGIEAHQVWQNSILRSWVWIYLFGSFVTYCNLFLVLCWCQWGWTVDEGENASGHKWWLWQGWNGVKGQLYYIFSSTPISWIWLA